MSRTIKSVAKACQIIDRLQKTDEESVTELADATGLTPGTVHSHLATLKEENYVVQDGTSYRLGPRLLTLGESVRNRADVYRAAKTQIETLAEETGESAHLIIEHDGRMFALYERFGQSAVGVEYHDRKREHLLNHLHCTAAGKAILSQFSEEAVRQAMDSWGMPKNTEHTITDVETLLDDLATVRDQGYASVDEEQMVGIRSVAAPIVYSESKIEGGVAISGPKARLTGNRFAEAIPKKVIQAANICEVNLHTLREESIEA